MSPPSPSTEPRPQRVLAALVGRPLFWLALVALLFGLPLARSLLRKLPPTQPVLGEVPEVVTTVATGEGAGQRFDGGTLRGRVWLATFLEPANPACDHLAAALTTVQRRARNLGDAYRLVSFVPPGADGRALADFTARHHPNPLRWLFLAATPPVELAISHAMHQAGLLPPLGAGSFGPAHAKHLAALVDRRGRVRGFYDPLGQAGLDALLADMGLAANINH